MTLKPCLECGDLSEQRRCEDCAPSTSALRGLSYRERGYDAAWDRLSATARRLQPWCTDCSTEDRLTADHLPRAWERKAAGLALRLEDVEVVCADCNSARGTSRPGSARAKAWGVDRTSSASGPVGKAKFATLSPEGPAGRCRTPCRTVQDECRTTDLQECDKCRTVQDSLQEIPASPAPPYGVGVQGRIQEVGR